MARVAAGGPELPTEEELLDYAVRLGGAAHRLVDIGADEALPTPSAVRERLRGVRRPEGMSTISLFRRIQTHPKFSTCVQHHLAGQCKRALTELNKHPIHKLFRGRELASRLK